jgi:hypothetical protein
MSKNEDKALYDTLRATGLRKKFARNVSSAPAGVNDKQSREVRKTAERLRMAAAALEHRVETPRGRTRPAKKSAHSPKRPAGRRVPTRRKGANRGGRS